MEQRRYVYLDLPGGEEICMDVPYVPPVKASPPLEFEPWTPAPRQIEASGCITNMTWDGIYNPPAKG